MKFTVRLLALLAVIALGGCRYFTAFHRAATKPASPAAAAEPLSPSPRLLVGRILAVDPARGFAFVDLVSEPPSEAVADGTELIARTMTELRDTARLRASRYLRGRTLGTTIVSGQPSPGDEVVWLAP